MALHPKSPGLINPILRVIDADTRTRDDLRARDFQPLFNPHLLTEQVGAVELAIDSQSDAKFAGTTGEMSVDM